MNGFHITIAGEEDGNKLTEIAFSAKRHWGYPEEWIELWTDELTISAQYIKNHFVFKAIDESQHSIVGFCAIEHHRQEKKLEIAHAWVLPSYIGKNIGSQLINYALKKLESLPFNRITVVADPNARGFYEKLGFRFIREIESIPKGRLLPVLEIEAPW